MVEGASPLHKPLLPLSFEGEGDKGGEVELKMEVELTQDKNAKDIILDKITHYKFINRFLGNIVKQRLEISNFEFGALTANLLCAEADNDFSLGDIDNDIRLGIKNCEGFNKIFRFGSLPTKSDKADGKILDLLAEVKTFRLLYALGAENIKYLKQKSTGKTVDFISTINQESYAIEVTRINLPESENKKVKPEVERQLLDEKGSLLGSFVLISSDNSHEPLYNTFTPAILREYKQLKEYIQRQNNNVKGMVVITVGRDYFVSKYARRDVFLPNTTKNALKEVVDDLYKSNKISDEYLKYVAYIIGRPFPDIYIYPNFHMEKIRL